MRVLDLFCGAGGAAMGLHRAWPHAEIVGVDIKPHPRYPFTFVQADAMTYPLEGYDFIWASPPCQRYSQCTPPEHRAKHPDLIAAVRQRLAGIPHCIENVPSARSKLRPELMLCGSMFGLKVRRHRFFELNPSLPIFTRIPNCQHEKSPVLITGTHRRTYEPRYEYSAQECRDAADLQWMTREDMDQAIPPAYSEFIAQQFSIA